MFTTQIVLLAATAVAPLASNAAPIFSGMFSKSTFARRADSNVQLAQGTNFFFSNLHLEAQCTPGQVACISGNLATCSGEANWEVSPCSNNTSCFAVPNADNTSIDVKCLAESEANSLIAQDGGQGGVSVDFQVTDAPFPNPNDPTPTATGANATDAPTATATDANGTDATDVPTSTDDSTPTGTDGGDSSETCIPDDGSDPTDSSTDGSDPTDTGSLADVPTSTPTDTATATDANVTGFPAPTATDAATDAPTDSCTADEPEQTETITLILVPNPTESGVYETETFTGQLPNVTGLPEASGSLGLGPGVEVTDVPTGTGTDAATDAPTGTDAAVPNPTESCTDSATDGSNDGGYTDGGNAGYTDAPSDAPASTDAPSTASRTTLTVSPALATPTTSTGINVIGTHNIPANPTKRAVKVNPFRFVKVRRS